MSSPLRYDSDPGPKREYARSISSQNLPSSCHRDAMRFLQQGGFHEQDPDCHTPYWGLGTIRSLTIDLLPLDMVEITIIHSLAYCCSAKVTRSYCWAYLPTHQHSPMTTHLPLSSFPAIFDSHLIPLHLNSFLINFLLHLDDSTCICKARIASIRRRHRDQQLLVSGKPDQFYDFRLPTFSALAFLHHNLNVKT